MPNPTHSHSGDEPIPQGAFKTVEYEDDGRASVTVTPASKAAQARAAGEPVKGGTTGAAGVESADELNDLTVPDLKQKADALGVEGTSSMNKADLVRSIRAAERKAAK